MLKSLVLASILALLSLTGCENVSSSRAAAPTGTPLDDTGIHVTGTVQSGVSSSLR